MAKAGQPADGSGRKGSRSSMLSLPAVQSASRGLTTIKGNDQAWMSPGNPLPAIVPNAAGRQYDFPVAVNLNLRPRSEEGVSFQDLRQLADAYYLARLCVETRKDQMVKLQWTVKPKDKKAKPDARCEELIAFFKSPDKRHDWQDWVRQLMEEVLVVDAPAVYCRQTIGGKPYALELMDGATIKVLLDEFGRTPLPPDPAYQQNLKGIPAVNYTTEELIYKPRNPRVWKAYGYSPIEQIIMIVNVGLRREISQLQFYTEGNIPEAIISTPETWTPDQVKQFQNYWDSIFEGNTASRRHAKFVPGAMTIHETKTAQLTDTFDEWLARVICYCFSLPTTAFVKQQNRATAETAKEQAEEEGLVPLMAWVADFLNYIIAKFFGYTDIAFVWEDEKSIDPLIQAQIDQIYLTTDVLDKNEVRERMGLEARDYEKEAADAMARNPAIDPKTGLPIKQDVTEREENGEKDPKTGENLPIGNNDAKSGDKSGDKAVKKKTYAKLSAANLKTAKALAGGLTKFFSKAKKTAIKQLVEAYAKYAPADADKLAKADESDADKILDSLDIDYTATINVTAKHLTKAAREGADKALGKLGGYADGIDAAEIAAGVGNYRAAELVGMKYNDDGKLVPNSNAAYRIDEGTRELLAADINEAMQEGWSTGKLASELEENYAFSEARAETIARTEIARADVQGSLETYRESGVVEGKKWLLAEEPCPICQGNADEGVIGLNEQFASGEDGPPAHPNCECDVSPVIKEDEQ